MGRAVNKRARLARRVIREHRRWSDLYLHSNLDWVRDMVEMRTLWACPRCPGRYTTVAPWDTGERISEHQLPVEAPVRASR